MNIKVLEVELALVHLNSDLLHFGEITANPVYAVHVKTLVFDLLYNVGHKQWDQATITIAKINQIRTVNTFLNLNNKKNNKSN